MANLEVYNDDGTRNEKMEGGFPLPAPGVNAIGRDGDAAGVIVSPYNTGMLSFFLWSEFYNNADRKSG